LELQSAGWEEYSFRFVAEISLREGRILGGSFAKILLKKKLGLFFLVSFGPGT
jgi:hypothetical protein